MSSNSSRFQKIAVLGGFVIFPIVLLAIFMSGTHHYVRLNYYGPKVPFDTIIDGEEVVDTIFHTIPYWEFDSQFGSKFNQDSTEDKILIVDFFFTHCPTICPKMTAQLRRTEMMLKDVPDWMILSYTIDPENDDVAQLASYAEKNGTGPNWRFLTGSKDKLYEVAKNGYFMHAEEDDNAPGGFMHSPMFMLIDKNKHIRGLYTGTDTEDVNRMVEELKMLLKEEAVRDSEIMKVDQ